MSRNFKDKIIYTPTLLIEFKGHPINSFTAEVYTAEGEIFDPYWTCNCGSIHAAYAEGLEKLKEAMIADNTYYRIEKYTTSLEEFATYKYFKNPIKRKLYKFYLWVGKIFKTPV